MFTCGGCSVTSCLRAQRGMTVRVCACNTPVTQLGHRRSARTSVEGWMPKLARLYFQCVAPVSDVSEAHKRPRVLYCNRGRSNLLGRTGSPALTLSSTNTSWTSVGWFESLRTRPVTVTVSIVSVFIIMGSFWSEKLLSQLSDIARH